MTAAAVRALAALLASTSLAVAGEHDGWPHYGGDAGGQHYSTLTEITRENVADLGVAWTYRHGDWRGGRGGDAPSDFAFEATPILAEDTLYFCTPLNRVIALDPATGTERWSFDPEIDLAGRYANQFNCRGVTFWRDPAAETEADCQARIFTGTNDARIALDASTGRPCPQFAKHGSVDLSVGVGEIHWKGEYQVTSAPVLAGDVVVVGTAISDNQTTEAPSGVVRGFDARTGELRWAFDPVRRGFEAAPHHARTEAGFFLGTANVWAPMSYDAERDLLFIPTGNSSPDYWGGHRRGLDEYASSVLALRGETGQLIWHFQTVHHDVWDYDAPAQPTLTELVRDGARVPAVLQTTKMGHLFVLHRETGVPLFPVEERPVPQGGVSGETLAATQPFPTKPPPLVRQRIGPEDAWGLTPFDRAWCRRRIEELRHDGPFAPPSLEGTLMYPGNAGGSNWGGIAVDPGRQVAVANVMDLAWLVTLFPTEETEARRRAEPGIEISPQHGTPFGMRRETFTSPLGLPCHKPPWGEIMAVDLAGGEILWRRPFGTTRDMTPLPLAFELGLPNLGGPLITARAARALLRAERRDSAWQGPEPPGRSRTSQGVPDRCRSHGCPAAYAHRHAPRGGARRAEGGPGCSPGRPSRSRRAPTGPHPADRALDS